MYVKQVYTSTEEWLIYYTIRDSSLQYSILQSSVDDLSVKKYIRSIDVYGLSLP